MVFDYNWKNKEANFGPPIKNQVNDGTHISFEIILKKDEKYVALRRKSIPGHEPPQNVEQYYKNKLFFCHDLIRYGESVEDCVKRIVKYQTGALINNCMVIYIESEVQEKDNQWAFTPHVIAKLKNLPKLGFYGNEITEVITFTKKDIPNEFGWWEKEDLKSFLEEYDN